MIDEKINVMKENAFEQGFKDAMNGEYDEDVILKDLNAKIPLKYRAILKRMTIDIQKDFFDVVIQEYRNGKLEFENTDR